MAAIEGTVNCASRDDTLGLLAGTAGCVVTAATTAVFSDSGLTDFFSGEVSEVDKADISFFCGFTGRAGTALVLAADLTATLGATGVADVLPESVLWGATVLEPVLLFGVDLDATGAAALAGTARVTPLAAAFAIPFDTTFFAAFGAALTTTLGALLAALLDAFFGSADPVDDFAAGLTAAFGAALGANLTFASLRETDTGVLLGALVLLTVLVFTSGLLDGADGTCSGFGTDNRLGFGARPSLATPLARRCREADASPESESARDCIDLTRPKPMSCRSETIIWFFVKREEKQTDLRHPLWCT